MYGTPLMRIHEAKRFEQHMNDCIRELSSGLLVAQQGCEADELLELTRRIGDIIAKLDTLLHEKIYNDHPELK
jgi:hypothetical protein